MGSSQFSYGFSRSYKFRRLNTQGYKYLTGNISHNSRKPYVELCKPYVYNRLEAPEQGLKDSV